MTLKFVEFVSLVKFSYWSNFHVNIIAGSWAMRIFISKGLKRNPEIGNTAVWVLPNIWRLGTAMDTKFGTNVAVLAVQENGRQEKKDWKEVLELLLD